mmetsp:Transcript_74570/g.129335  ORF Transcript_74570/g.129335 Transcript_74570/m.129335 type:complete len:670 (-) Transcript_74570:79-2088(-)
MQTMRALVLALGFLAVAQADQAGAQVTPVQKVIQLMEGMLAKGKEEKHDEQTQFAAYKQFCDDTSEAKASSIEKAGLTIEVLKADIAKHAASAAELAQAIAGHEEDIAVWEGDIGAATKVRSIEKADFDKMNLDYSESVDALERAIAVLKKEAYDRKQASSLVQLNKLKTLDLIPAKAKKTIDLFLAQGMDESEITAPEANAYEFQSGSIVDILEKLLDEFIAKRTDLQKEEMNSKHAFEMLITDLTQQISQAKEDKTTASNDKAMNLEGKASATGELEDTMAMKAADEKYKSDLDATCAQKASDFESRQLLRSEELEAIEKAIAIISSSAVSGSAAKYLPSMMQQKKMSAALAQLRTVSSTEAQARVAKYLNQQAAHLHSRVLASLAARVSEDPFGKVKKMIKDLIVKLMDEANEEATHKGWCDTELATNEQTRKEKTATIESLNAEIDELTASIALTTEQIAELTAAVADLDAKMAEATKLRAEENEKNAQTVKDAQEAQLAVTQAMTVLKEFYGKASEATALMQQAPPPIFEGAYKGMQAENGGVIGMLEVIQSDFARLESDTKTSEASALKEYETFMSDSKIDKTAKTTDIDHKTIKKEDESAALNTKKGDLEDTQGQLDAALVYFDKLKPSCVDERVDYTDRVARRQEEIASLQEALKILNGEA